ncbi:hypothetical protein RHGRI_017712 [Rhododendron griersonianum]|uniref:Uncharacterized protein n=1 Tax=Rhododendron griersonianum TaxID=479676 RepID=A0AAV6JYW7_9ERIC|nr:hypothetical protein RHGRI_017712 [Rhododendron griersonianum]
MFGVSTPFGSSVVYPPFGNSQFGLPQFGVPHYGVQQFGPPQIGFNQQFGSPQLGFNQFGTSLIGSQPAGTQLFGSFRGFSRGRGRGPRMPCDICGRSNHSTNYCYYKPPQLGFPSQFSSQVSWRGPGSSTQWGTSGGIPMFQPPQTFPSRPSASQLSIPASQTVGTPQANLAAFSDNLSAMHISSSSGIPSGSSQNIIHPSTAFHLSSNLPQMASSSVQTAVTTPQSHPWFFDSGATNHITNNVQNLTNPQPAGIIF